MAACQWLTLIRESAYGTPVTPTTLNEDYIVLELLDDNPVDNFEDVPTNEQLYSWLACGDADRAIGETNTIEGTLRTLLYPEQAPILFGWGLTLVDQDADPDEPWTTTEPNGQFASMAAAWSYRDDSGTERKDRLLGGKVTRFGLSAARGTRDGAFVLELGTRWKSRTTASDTAPAAADYPTGSPYFLSATSGGLVVNGQTISDYESIALTAEYEVSPRYDESATVSRIRHRRRDYTLELQSLLKFTPDWRALRDNRSTFAVSLDLVYPGGTGEQEINFSFPKARVADNGWTKSLPIAADRTQTLNLMAEFDRATETNFAVTIGEQV